MDAIAGGDARLAAHDGRPIRVPAHSIAPPEDGDLALEKSLELFERGVQLSRFCHSKLEEAERRVEILTERGEIKPAPETLGAVAEGDKSR